MRVRFQGRRALALRDAEQQQRQPTVHGRGDKRHDHPEGHVVQRLRLEEALHGGPDDQACGHHDQGGLQHGGKVLGLGVTVRVLVVGRSARDVEGQEQHPGGHQVDQRLRSVRQEAHRARYEVGHALQRQDGHGAHEAQPRRPHGHVASRLARPGAVRSRLHVALSRHERASVGLGSPGHHCSALLSPASSRRGHHRSGPPRLPRPRPTRRAPTRHAPSSRAARPAPRLRSP